ncbi:MAG: hypothetical protein M1838_001811 [Thelocarpon superellum]|nr:MAG: hypothetical protein M1838_001811 [Thelocarpon superellum]
MTIGARVPYPTILSRRYLRAGYAVFVIFFLYGFYVTGPRLSHSRHIHRPHGVDQKGLQHFPGSICDLNVSSLHRYELSPDFHYARRYITTQVVEDEQSRPMGKVEGDLVPQLQHVSRAQDDLIPLSYCQEEPLALSIRPARRRYDNATVLFGVATTAQRLKDSLPQMHHWLTRGNGRLVALVPNDEMIPEVRTEMQAWGIDGTVKISKADYPSRYFDLVKELHNEVRALSSLHAPVQWVSLIDDDTFFPSMTNLISMLKTHDHTKPQYVGAVSEDFHQIVRHGYFAFGGAGIFLSLPLLDELMAAYPACRQSEENVDQGDLRLVHCIFHHTTTKLSVEHGLHQMDLFGDPRGLFESGRSLLSLHHWKSWFRLDVMKLSMIADVCGEDCILQRWTFRPSPISVPKRPVTIPFISTTFSSQSKPPQSALVLNNGFSIVEYLTPLPPDFQQVEKTWDINADLRDDHTRTLADDATDFAHSLAPIRAELEEGKDKISYDLVDSIREPGGRVRQVYIKRGKSSKEPGKAKGDFEDEEDVVIELIWAREFSWTQSEAEQSRRGGTE